MFARVLQKLYAFLALSVYLLSLTTSPFVAIYLLLFTRFWWLMLLYLAWMYLDRDISEKGGRRFEWVRNSKPWIEFAKYVDHQLETLPGVVLDPAKNYLFACFPHGLVPVGAGLSFFSQDKFNEKFPYHYPTAITLSLAFLIPFAREYALALGFCSSSRESLKWLLNKKGGGNVVGLVVGGAAESYNCGLPNYRLFLKNRKGFVRIALECGSPLVPTFTFGEKDLFTLLGGEGSFLRRFQRAFHRKIGFVPLIPLGCGLFQDYFGIIPRQKKLTHLVGKPIPVDKVDNPTREQVDQLHQKFIEELMTLFEENKHKYVEDYENVKVEIE